MNPRTIEVKCCYCCPCFVDCCAPCCLLGPFELDSSFQTGSGRHARCPLTEQDVILHASTHTSIKPED